MRSGPREMAASPVRETAIVDVRALRGEALRRLGREGRLAAYRRGEFDLGTCCLWASRYPHEVPLLNQRVRQAWRKGARVHVVNPVDFDFTFDIAGRQIGAPSRIADALGSVGAIAAAVALGDGGLQG